MNVVATAPIPGVRIPSFPRGTAIFVGFSMKFLGSIVGGTIRARPTSFPGHSPNIQFWRKRQGYANEKAGWERANFGCKDLMETDLFTKKS
jgi:hypothetical protein